MDTTTKTLNRFQFLYDKYVRKGGDNTAFSSLSKTHLSFDVLKLLISYDPTTKTPIDFDYAKASVDTMVDIKVGQYSKWLIKHYLNPEIRELYDINEGTFYLTEDINSERYQSVLKEYRRRYEEDLMGVKNDLINYRKYKFHIPNDRRDINKLTPHLLSEVINSIPDEVIDKKNKKTLKTEIRLVREGFYHPGATIEIEGSEYTLIKIEGEGPKQMEAASWYGGYYDYINGESKWCTSPPESNYFNTYIKQGPLYVILKNNDELSKRTGLPIERYQFHFQSNQFMDRHNQQISLPTYFNGKFKEFKEYFKKDFVSKLLSSNGNKVEVNYPEGSSGKFIAIYGFESMFNSLPEDINHLIICNKSKERISFKVPETINKFKNLTALLLQNIVSELPDNIGELTKLKFLSLCGNKFLDGIPESIADLPELLFLNVKDCNSNLTIPKNITDGMDYEGNGYYSKKNIL